MKCAICGEETKPGRATVTLERGETTLVFRHVPAAICSQCGEKWIDGEITARLLAILDRNVKDGAEVVVHDYARAA
jgi:YgiT-type zinc finger domain-containing protein